MEIVFTDLFIKNLNKAGRYTDQQTPGLNIQVKAATNIKRYWTFRYVYAGKRYDLALGAYPNINLKEARKRAINARSTLNQGKKPPHLGSHKSFRPTSPPNQSLRNLQ